MLEEEEYATPPSTQRAIIAVMAMGPKATFDFYVLLSQRASGPVAEVGQESNAPGSSGFSEFGSSQAVAAEAEYARTAPAGDQRTALCDLISWR